MCPILSHSKHKSFKCYIPSAAPLSPMHCSPCEPQPRSTHQARICPRQTTRTDYRMVESPLHQHTLLSDFHPQGAAPERLLCAIMHVLEARIQQLPHRSPPQGAAPERLVCAVMHVLEACIQQLPHSPSLQIPKLSWRTARSRAASSASPAASLSGLGTQGVCPSVQVPPALTASCPACAIHTCPSSFQAMHRSLHTCKVNERQHPNILKALL